MSNMHGITFLYFLRTSYKNINTMTILIMTLHIMTILLTTKYKYDKRKVIIRKIFISIVVVSEHHAETYSYIVEKLIISLKTKLRVDGIQGMVMQF